MNNQEALLAGRLVATLELLIKMPTVSANLPAPIIMQVKELIGEAREDLGIARPVVYDPPQI